MAKKKKFVYDPDWAKAKKLCRLSAEDIRMAKELGFKPRTLIKNQPSPQQQWKQPVKFWIRELYEKMKRKQALKQERKDSANESTAKLPPPRSEPGSESFQDEVPF